MLECWNVLNEHQSYRWIFRLIINLVFQRDIWKFKKLSVDLRSLEFTEEALLDERTLMTYFSFTFTSSITRIYFFSFFFETKLRGHDRPSLCFRPILVPSQPKL